MMIIALKYKGIKDYLNSDHIVSFWDGEVDNEKCVFVDMVNDTIDRRIRRFTGFAYSDQELSAEILFNKLKGRV